MRPLQLAAVLAWVAFGVVVSVAFAQDGWELGSFIAFWPAAVALGMVVPRWWLVLAPVALAVGLGLLAYEITCPCYEDTRESFVFWWELGMGVPSVALIAAGVAIRRSFSANVPH